MQRLRPTVLTHCALPAVIVFGGLGACARLPKGPPLPEADMTMEHALTDRCSGNQAVDCYLRGLSLAKEATTAGKRREAVSLISEACAVNIAEACETLDERLRLPRRIDGRAPQYTSKSLGAGFEGQVVVRCLLPETGVLEGCRVEPPPSEEQRRRFAQGKVEEELLDAFAAWKLTPALFDDRPFPFDFVFRMRFVFPLPLR